MKKFLLFVFSILTFGVLNAQDPTVIFSEDFDEGLGDFTTGEGTPEGAVWQWTPNGKADSAIIDDVRVNASFYGNLPAIGSPTGENGAAMFNSDAYDNGGDPEEFGTGPLPAPQTDELTSPIIDCSDYERVTLVFYQFGRMLLDDNTRVEVSGDGGLSWTTYQPNQRAFSNEVNEIIDPDSRVVIDISEVAGGSSEVQFRFVWLEGTYYFWIIDDVALIESPEYNLAISDFFYPLSSFATPQSQIGTDTFGFSARISNLGTQDQTNIVLKATVFDAEGEEYYTDSTTIETLPSGYLDSLVIIPTTFAPELQEGIYGIIYETYSEDNDDYFEDDNADGEIFSVTDNIFSKDDGFLVEDAEWPSGFPINEDYQIGNVYTVSSQTQDNLVATAATFAAFRPDSQGPITDNVVNILLYRVKDRVDPNFDNFNINSTGSQEEDDDLELAGFGTYTFPEDHDAFEAVTVDLEDFDGNPVQLDPGARYFLVADYQGTSNAIIHLISDDINYAAGLVSSVIFSDGEWGGLGRRNSPILRLEVSLTDSRDKTPLPEYALRLFPNPTSELVSVELNLDKPADALVFIADLSGKILSMQQYQSVQKETLSFNVGNLPAGSYLLRVATGEGTKTTQFVVAR